MNSCFTRLSLKGPKSGWKDFSVHDMDIAFTAASLMALNWQ